MAASPLLPEEIQNYRYLNGTNFEDAITAKASGTQATAYQLSAQLNTIDTCATAADSVALPKVGPWAIGTAVPGGAGFLCFIWNNGAQSCQVYGGTNAKDTINDVATATGVALPAGAAMIAWVNTYTQSTDVGEWSAMIVSAAGQLLATQTNDNAKVGNVGEFLTTTVASGSAIAETTATPVDVCTLALTPGDWDVSAVVDRTLTGTTATIYGAGISLTLNTLPTQAGGSGLGTDALVTQAATFGTTVTGVGSTVIPPVRVSLAANTTLHLVAGDTFSAGSVAVFGTIRARRVR